MKKLNASAMLINGLIFGIMFSILYLYAGLTPQGIFITSIVYLPIAAMVNDICVSVSVKEASDDE